MPLSKLCPQLGCELLDQFLHDRINGFIIECLVGILQNEIHRIALFACRKVLSFIDIKEFHALQELLFCLNGNLFYLFKLYIFIYQQCQITTDGRELTDFLKLKFSLFVMTNIPVGTPTRVKMFCT